jgi:hypothetical protein
MQGVCFRVSSHRRTQLQNAPCQPSSPPRCIIKPWIARQSGRCISGLLAGTDPHQCDLSHFRFSTEVTNRQKGEDFHSRQPSPISLTQPSGTIATPQVTPATAWRTIQSCLNDSNVENTCLHRRRPQMSKLEMLLPQNSAIAMIDYQPAMY